VVVRSWCPWDGRSWALVHRNSPAHATRTRPGHTCRTYLSVGRNPWRWVTGWTG